jgi:ParB family chromosome partitioning protein
VSELLQTLKTRGLESPYLRNFVVARISLMRFRRSAGMPIDEALSKAARDLARSGGAGTSE